MGPIYLFTARSIPVFVAPWYFLALAYMVYVAQDVAHGLLWAACVTVSILVHEFGHGLMALWFKLEPSILLHGWGGLTAHTSARRDRDDALIILAGPAAGLLLGAVVFAAAWAAERAFPGVISTNLILERSVHNLLYLNLFWSLVNLVPMFPLDGGLLFRLGVYKRLRPLTAERVVHGTGLVLAVAWAVVGSLVWNSAFMVIMGLMFAYQNYGVLAGRTRAPKSRAATQESSNVLDEARRAWTAGDAREAARLCHVLRASGELPAPVQAEAFALIVIANGALGQHAEVLSWARYAPVTGPVIEARITALHALGKVAEARALLAEHGAVVAAAARAELERKLAA
jgi:stage IV sporulation protein FB